MHQPLSLGNLNNAAGFGQNRIFQHPSETFLDCLWVVGEVGEENDTSSYSSGSTPRD